MFCICPFHWATIPSQRRLLVVVSMKCFCWLKKEYCSTTQNCLLEILSLSAKHCWSKSTKIANLDFSRELEEKLRGKIERRKWTFLSQNFESWEENMFAKSHSFEKRNFSSKSRIPRGEREFFLQNLDNQDYIEKWKFNSPAQEKHFLSRFSQGRESRQCRGGAVCVGVEGVLLDGPACDELNFTPIL